MPDTTDPSDQSADEVSETSASTVGKRRGKTRKRHTVGTVVLAALLVLGITTTLAVVFTYRHLNDNLDRKDLSAQLTNRPDKSPVDTGPKEPLNILVMGSDTREGEGNNIDGLTLDSERSDTTILFHLSADRKFAYGVSIPRDTLVDRPDCKDEKGEVIPGETSAQWNDAFAVGGPACTIQQVEQLTGVFVDNYVVLDFQGFQDMVEAIDGVEVCIPEDISDPAHGIDIPAGTREVRGQEALSYVRARYTLGDGSDIGRIKRQQAFIAAMASKVVSAGTLTRLDRLVGFLDAATSSLQTDFGSVLAIGKVGVTFKSIGLDNISFVTVPFQYSPEDPNRVEWLPEADQLWQRIIDDRPLPASLRSGVISAGDDVDGDSGGTGGPSDGSGGTGSGGGDTDEDSTADREAAGLCA